MMYSAWYEEVEALVSVLQAMKLPMPIMHCEKHIGEKISKGGEELTEAYQLFEINCKIAKSIGATKIVIHLWDGITSDANFHNNLKAYLSLSYQ